MATLTPRQRRAGGVLGVILAGAAACTATTDDAAGDGTYRVHGVAQKGPFQVGATVTIQELADRLEPVGKTYVTTTTDDLGTFDLETPLASGFIEVLVQGRFYDELQQKAGETVTLHALVHAKAVQGGTLTLNVNLLTHLQSARLKTLVDSGQAFASAETQSRGEVLGALGLPPLAQPFASLSLSETGDANGELLAASVLLAEAVDFSSRNGAGVAVADLLDSLRQDLADGKVDTPRLTAALAGGREALPGICADTASDAIINTLRAYYAERGAIANVPEWRSFFTGEGGVVWTIQDAGCPDGR